jgi:hypothetical protein
MEKETFRHRMVLYNHDLEVYWHFENGQIKVTEVYIIKSKQSNIVDCLGRRAFQYIVEDIEKNDLKL